MTTGKSAKKPVETIPLHIQRGVMIGQRARAVRSRLGSLLERPFTRTGFTNAIESLLTDAGFTFCRYVYAKANGKHREATRCWDEVQGIIEYELPMVLLHPVKDLKSRKSRERAAAKVLPIIKAEMAQYKKRTEEMYLDWKDLHLNKPLNRPDKSRFEEFFRWVECVTMSALGVE